MRTAWRASLRRTCASTSRASPTWSSTPSRKGTLSAGGKIVVVHLRQMGWHVGEEPEDDEAEQGDHPDRVRPPGFGERQEAEPSKQTGTGCAREQTRR